MPSFHYRGTGSIPGQGNSTCHSRGMAKKKKRKNNFLLWLVVKYEKLDLVNRVTLLWETPSPREQCSGQDCRASVLSKQATEFAALLVLCSVS